MRSFKALIGIGIAAFVLGVCMQQTIARANCYETIGCSNSSYFKISDLKKLGCQPLFPSWPTSSRASNRGSSDPFQSSSK